MATELINAFFLHKRLSGETSLRVSFFTREHGIVDALYKGGRTPKKQSFLQPFSPLWLALDVRGDWYYVKKIECELSNINLSGPALYAGLYVNEIIYSLLKSLDASNTLYSAYINAIESLSSANCRFSVEIILRRFERVLLSKVGYALSLTYDAQSGEEIAPMQTYQFIAGVGLVSSSKGFLGAHLLSVAEEKLDEPDVLRIAKYIHQKAIAHAMDGKEIKTRALYSSSCYD